MIWQDRATELTQPSTPAAAEVRSALEHAALGLLTFPAATDVAAPMALLFVDLAIGELDDARISSASQPTVRYTGPVTHAEVTGLLRWAEGGLRTCDGEPEQVLACARAAIDVREALTALPDE